MTRQRDYNEEFEEMARRFSKDTGDSQISEL